MMAETRRVGSRAVSPSWTDDDVSGVLTAEIIVGLASAGIPGFDSVRKLVGDYEQARAGYMSAARERYPSVAKKRAALQRGAARISEAPIDWKATLAGLTPAHPTKGA